MRRAITAEPPLSRAGRDVLKTRACALTGKRCARRTAASGCDGVDGRRVGATTRSEAYRRCRCATACQEQWLRARCGRRRAPEKERRSPRTDDARHSRELSTCADSTTKIVVPKHEQLTSFGLHTRVTPET